MNTSEQSEVSEQMNNIDNVINNLVDISDGLRERLSGVLRQPDKGSDCEKAEQVTLCNHADQLRLFDQRLQSIRQNLMSLREQIEL